MKAPDPHLVGDPSSLRIPPRLGSAITLVAAGIALPTASAAAGGQAAPFGDELRAAIC